jgi:hypothetical protein
MGLETAPLAAAQLSPEIKGYGRVLDPSPLASLVADLTTATAQSDASQAEMNRLKALAAQSNASARALQSAEAAATRDQAQVSATRLRLLSGWGAAIAQRQDLPAFVQSLSALDIALVEIDVPAGDSVTATPTGARLLTLAYGATPITAQVLGPATASDPQMQGRGFLLLVTPNPARLVPGTAVEGFLSLPGEMQSGVCLPAESIVRYKDAAWVYVETGDNTFRRTEVSLGRPLDNGWFVREGLKPQIKVVTVGAQQLLSEELKGQTE